MRVTAIVPVHKYMRVHVAQFLKSGTFEVFIVCMSSALSFKTESREHGINKSTPKTTGAYKALRNRYLFRRSGARVV